MPDKEVVPPPQDIDIKELEKAFDGDLDLFLFFVTWIKNGMDGTKAYEELHPEVTHGSAKVLGSRWLARVNRDVVMAVYGLGPEKYFNQLRDGLEAEKRDQFTGEVTPDHKTRLAYHDKLGKLLGLETDAPAVAVQVNNYRNLTDEQLDQLIESKLRQVRAGDAPGGEAAQDQTQSA